MSQLILSPGSVIYRTFSDLIAEADRVFFAGLPGVGKSLLLQQMALMALDAGRQVHLLQWDVARQAFETPRYPLENGASHPLVIQATGAWLRGALVEWEASAATAGAMLIGEAPLIGGRLMEIVRRAPDEAEALLRDLRTQFLVPLPSREVRAFIEARREQSIAEPQHENEAHDAPPDLLRALWGDLYRVAFRLGLAETDQADPAYSPGIYAAVYRHLLRYRHCQLLPIDQPLPTSGSVYDEIERLPNRQASPAQAAAIMAELEATMPSETVHAAARNWYRF